MPAVGVSPILTLDCVIFVDMSSAISYRIARLKESSQSQQGPPAAGLFVDATVLLLPLLPAVVCRMLQIRSIDYMQTKVKQPSSKAIYRLVAMDLFGSDTKASHVSRIFQLPATGVLLLGAACKWSVKPAVSAPRGGCLAAHQLCFQFQGCWLAGHDSARCFCHAFVGADSLGSVWVVGLCR